MQVRLGLGRGFMVDCDPDEKERDVSPDLARLRGGVFGHGISLDAFRKNVCFSMNKHVIVLKCPRDVIVIRKIM